MKRLYVSADLSRAQFDADSLDYPINEEGNAGGVENLEGENKLGAWKTMENEWADWIKKGYQVDYDIKVHPPGAVRPTDFQAKYKVIDPKTGEVKYENRHRFKKPNRTKIFENTVQRYRIEKMSENMELMGNIARSILTSIEEEGELEKVDWAELSLVVTFDKEGDVESNFGYAYDRSGAFHAFSTDAFTIEPSFKEYRQWLGGGSDKGILKMLYQFNRETNKVNADFEYDNPNRWQVTPNNVDQIVEDLKPNLF